MTMPPQVATPDRPALSPSGNFQLVVQEQEEGGNPVLTFQIFTSDDQLLYTSPDQFQARHMTFFLWDDADRVWVYSGDVGTYFWEQQGDAETWQKFTYANSDVPAPPFLKETRPTLHPK